MSNTQFFCPVLLDPSWGLGYKTVAGGGEAAQTSPLISPLSQGTCILTAFRTPCWDALHAHSVPVPHALCFILQVCNVVLKIVGPRGLSSCPFLRIF